MDGAELAKKTGRKERLMQKNDGGPNIQQKQKVSTKE